MAGKKSTDATKNLPAESPTQVGPGGTRLRTTDTRGSNGSADEGGEEATT